VDDAVVVEIGYCGEDCSDEVGGVGFEVGPFSTYAVEKLTSKGEISDKVYCGNA